MDAKKSVKQRALDFLSHKAWGGIRTIVYLIVLFGGVPLAILIGIGRLFLEYKRIPFWILIVLGLLSLYGVYSLIRSLYENRLVRTPPSNGKVWERHEYWKVYWLLNTRTYQLSGPYCPRHWLQMDTNTWLSTGSARFEFQCRGDEGEEGHTIKGPSGVQIGGSRPEDIRHDVKERIMAERLKKQLEDKPERSVENG